MDGAPEMVRTLLVDAMFPDGMRPDVPSNGSVRIEPGETREVNLAPIGGNRIVHGFNNAVDGPLDTTDMNTALQRLTDCGCLHAPEHDQG